jgi:hypothetical protein
MQSMQRRTGELANQQVMRKCRPWTSVHQRSRLPPSGHALWMRQQCCHLQQVRTPAGLALEKLA